MDTRRRALRCDVRCGLVLARPPQDEEDQPVGIVPLRSRPPVLQACEFVLVEGSGDCLADVGMLRAEPAVFGPVASDPTVSRFVDTVAASGPKALAAIRGARSEVRQWV
ncbi:hypothetical protein AB0K24_50380 [Streptomyces mirabilis]|uniref:hypothetical protein n=1 Tax=Streptomyces sp. GbtcB7 TaxID=2824752 RepID=UPI002671AE43|nr:hypothetical protein [Streptomyces sp. GbtcB7]